MQNHDIKTQCSIITELLIVLILLISVMFITYMRGYVQNDAYDSKLNVSFENTVD